MNTIGTKQVVIDGKEYTVKVYPPASSLTSGGLTVRRVWRRADGRVGCKWADLDYYDRRGDFRERGGAGI